MHASTRSSIDKNYLENHHPENYQALLLRWPKIFSIQRRWVKSMPIITTSHLFRISSFLTLLYYPACIPFTGKNLLCRNVCMCVPEDTNIKKNQSWKQSKCPSTMKPTFLKYSLIMICSDTKKMNKL